MRRPSSSKPKYRLIKINVDTYERLKSVVVDDRNDKEESFDLILKRLIDDHETLENWDGDPYESPWADEYRAQREKTKREIERGVERINKRCTK